MNLFCYPLDDRKRKKTLRRIKTSDASKQKPLQSLCNANNLSESLFEYLEENLV